MGGPRPKFYLYVPVYNRLWECTTNNWHLGNGPLKVSHVNGTVGGLSTVRSLYYVNFLFPPTKVLLLDWYCLIRVSVYPIVTDSVLGPLIMVFLFFSTPTLNGGSLVFYFSEQWFRWSLFPYLFTSKWYRRLLTKIGSLCPDNDIFVSLVPRMSGTPLNSGFTTRPFWGFSLTSDTRFCLLLFTFFFFSW